MAAGRTHTLEITRYIRKLRGGSQPILVEASDGALYVAKFAGNLQGANLLFNESAGAELYRACGLNVPSWRPLELTEAFIDRNPACWIEGEHGSARPSAGLCFGSRYLGTYRRHLLEILPGTSYRRVSNRSSFWLSWLVDICAEHADNRQTLFLEDSRGAYEAYFVDNGHLFGGPEGNRRVHYVASRYLDARIYPDVSSERLLQFRKTLETLEVDRLWQRVHALPDEWQASSALSGLERCLQRLAEPALLRNLLDAIVTATLRRLDIERSAHRTNRKRPVPVLCPRVQAATRSLIERRPAHLACG